MNSLCEVWIAPENGPLIVQERDTYGRTCWEESEAIEIAKTKRRFYSNLHFWVRRPAHDGKPAEIVFKTNV